MLLNVLELDQLRVGHHDFEESADDLMQLRAAVRLRQHLDLGGRRDVEAERDGYQR